MPVVLTNIRFRAAEKGSKLLFGNLPAGKNIALRR
jgi:hypothetical protein